MKKMMMIPLAAVTALAAGCTSTGGYGGIGAGAGYDDGGYGYYDQNYYSQYGNYDYNRPDPRHGGYYADNYYRSDRRYKERRLSSNDRVYRGRDNKYYCRRNDGSTGLIVGGIAGGVLGNVIAPGGSELIGTLIGAGAGALIGREVDKGEARCR